MTRRTLSLLFVILAAASISADTRIVDLGSRKVRVRTEGAGPSVVFEAGFGSNLDTWHAVIDDVAKFARVFAYDRAGLGQSDAVSGERSYTALAGELHEVLKHENIPPPYLFVGHSYGGALARVFYKLYANEVSGIVFVDPMNDAFINIDPDREKNLALQDASVKGRSAGVVAEWAYLKADAANHYRELLKYGAPNVPMALIVASIDKPPASRRSAVDHYGSWVVDRSDSLLIVTPNSGHVVMRDEPALVIGAIRTLLFPMAPLSAANTADEAIAIFRRYPKEVVTPVVLNSVGYKLLRAKNPKDAIKVFALNVATFPNDANAYDSLAEAYLDAGDEENALKNYRRSLELDPTNETARRVIARLTK